MSLAGILRFKDSMAGVGLSDYGDCCPQAVSTMLNMIAEHHRLNEEACLQR